MMIAGGLSFVAAGCILGDDPNHNSMVYGAQAGSSGTAGNNGTAGTNGGGGSNIETLVGTPVATFDTTIQSVAFSTDDETTNLAVHNGGTGPNITWDGTDRSPTAMARSL